MSAINPPLPNDGEAGWGDTLNTALQNIIDLLNAHDGQITAIGQGTFPPSATTSSQGVVQLSGDLTGTADAPLLKTILTAGTAGDASDIPIITWDANGRITGVTTAVSTAVAPPDTGRTVTTVTDTLHTFVLNDKNNIVEYNNTLDGTFTIPPHSSVAYPLGSMIRLINTNTGALTIAGGAGVTLTSAQGFRLITQWASATLIQRAIDFWVLTGTTAT